MKKGQVRLQSLSKKYGGMSAAVSDVSLDIAPGEFVVLVGPSGCGKSTLLRMVAGLEEPTTGSIWIGDRKVDELAPAQRGVAMVFQDYALYPHMSVRENLEFGLRQGRHAKMERSERERRVMNAVRLLGMGDWLMRKPAQLSGGQRQRVAIGRALVKEPEVFLFDEPLSNLDAKLRAETRVEIAALHRRLGSTTLYVTHDQVEAMTLADRLVVLKEGVIQQEGRPLDLYRDPGNRFVAAFLGSPGMNFLEGQREGLTLGVRPESVRLVQSQSLGGLPGRVELVEFHGAEVQVVVSVGSGKQSARWMVRAPGAEGTAFRPGDSCQVQWNEEDLYWFDRQGRRIHNGAHAPLL